MRVNTKNKILHVFLSVLLFTGIFIVTAHAETASDLVLQEAKNEATQLEAVRSALLLDYSANYNQYLEDYQDRNPLNH